jgi:hypothetical protein
MQTQWSENILIFVEMLLLFNQRDGFGVEN